MEYTIRTPKGFNYTLLKPGVAEGSELAMHRLCQSGGRGTKRIVALYTHPLLLGTRAKIDRRRMRRVLPKNERKNQREDRCRDE